MNIARLKASTKSLLGAAVAGGSLLQIPAVHDTLAALTLHHPRWVGAVATATAIAALLHNPQVQDVLGIKRTVKVEEVVVTPQGEGEAQ